MWKEKSVHIIFHLLKHSFQNTNWKATIQITEFSPLEEEKKKNNISSSFPILLPEPWAYENTFIT